MIKRNPTFWAVVLILLGTWLLLDNLNLLPARLGSIFWPVVLILVGAWFLWGALGTRQLATQELTIPLRGKTARLEIRHGAGRLHIGSGAAAGSLLSGTFTGGVDWTDHLEGEKQAIALRVPAGAVTGFPFWAGPSNTLDWHLGLASIPLDLKLETGAGESTLDLQDLRIGELTLKTGASSTKVILPARAGLTRVCLYAGAASVSLQVPDGVGAKIRQMGGLSGIQIDTHRFVKSGDTYTSADYSASENRVEIEAEIGVGSLDIK